MKIINDKQINAEEDRINCPAIHQAWGPPAGNSHHYGDLFCWARCRQAFASDPHKDGKKINVEQVFSTEMTAR
jgi:hypothetical protein